MSKKKASPKTSDPVATPSPTSPDSKFLPFADLVRQDFQRVTAQPEVFVVDVGPDALWTAYLGAFPEGTNPIAKTRTEHDCSTCRQFVRRAGSAVAVVDGAIVTVWDRAAAEAQHPFGAVATKLRDLVVTANLADLLRIDAKESSFGARESHTLVKADLPGEPATVVTHYHFHTGEIPQRLRVASPGADCGDYRTTVQLFERGLTELTPDAVDTVLSLIEANSLYRGEEHRRAVLEFRQARVAYGKLGSRARHLYAWSNARGPAARFRNTVIGTLVQDLSGGADVDVAVRAFEAKVAPQNYKRTSAVITPSMVKKAMETIAALGLESALERRFAVMADVSVGDVLWVDGAARALMKGGIGDVLMQHAAAATKSAEDEKHAEAISLDDFVAQILPGATSVELLLKGELLGNLVSLTAPVHPDPRQLFRWTNDFAWSYGGNVADSIKERVKKAGGRVEGATLRVSLSWFNHDDLDLHVHQPPKREVDALDWPIFYRNKRGWTGGTLDVDMNAGGGHTREPVENVVWTRPVPDGAYWVVVNNFCQRERSDVGFVVEVEFGGKVSHYSFNKTIGTGQNVDVVTLHVRNGNVEGLQLGNPAVTTSNVSQEKWGLRTEQYVKVNAVTLSPNFWGGCAAGNKHTFFLLDGARCDEPTRGIYNEFLHPRLEAHRKVFEVIGDKTKCQPTDGALSGLGFSSTKRDSFIARVQQGKRRRLLRVNV